jgi:hypothetical protein
MSKLGLGQPVWPVAQHAWRYARVVIADNADDKGFGRWAVAISPDWALHLRGTARLIIEQANGLIWAEACVGNGDF